MKNKKKTKELEQELEEQREVERPPSAEPMTPVFDKRLEQLTLHGAIDRIISGMKNDGILLTIPQSLTHTRLFRFCRNNEKAWAEHLYVTKDFKNVIISSSPSCDEFLRPIWWIARIKNSNGKDILIILSSHECNLLLPAFRMTKNSTLFMYRARKSKFHRNLLHEPRLRVTQIAGARSIDIDDEVQVGIFAGSMYFANEAEMNAYCGFLGRIPRPRNLEQATAFEMGIIQPKGYVPMENRQYSEAISSYVGQCKFNDNPVDLAIELIEAHHQTIPKFSHAASILIRGIKPAELMLNDSSTSEAMAMAIEGKQLTSKIFQISLHFIRLIIICFSFSDFHIEDN